MSDETTLRGMTSLSFFCYLLDDNSIPKKIKNLARVSRMLLTVIPEPEDVTEELQGFTQEANECYQISVDNLAGVLKKEAAEVWDTFLERIPPEIQDCIELEGKS